MISSKASTYDTEVVLSVRNLKVHFWTQEGTGAAVDGISFDLRRGETLGLVGESGSGKSITALALVGLHPQPAARIVGGEILFNEIDLTKLSPNQLRRYRGKRIAMILQDPLTALNPVFTIKDQIAEPLRQHQGLKGRQLIDRAVEMLRLLRIPAPARRLKDYPHQFSGGMRQRVVGAIAMSCNPEVLIADEPTTSLDVTIQAAYLALLKDVQQRMGQSILFITHDFGVVARMCDRVAVMYAGRIVESADTKDLFERPLHPYSEALLASISNVATRVERLPSIEGAPPSIYSKPAGCHFAPRCALRRKLGDPDRCAAESPLLRQMRPGHAAACHFAEELI
jgi:oligopeptide/dipeptide ABC transporter ATP-binding protein